VLFELLLIYKTDQFWLQRECRKVLYNALYKCTTKGLLGSLQANTYRLFHFWCCHLRSVKRRPDPERLTVNRPNELGHVVFAVYIRVILLVKVEGAQGEGEPADSTPETASGKKQSVHE